MSGVNCIFQIGGAAMEAVSKYLFCVVVGDFCQHSNTGTHIELAEVKGYLFICVAFLFSL